VTPSKEKKRTEESRTLRTFIWNVSSEKRGTKTDDLKGAQKEFKTLSHQISLKGKKESGGKNGIRLVRTSSENWEGKARRSLFEPVGKREE